MRFREPKEDVLLSVLSLKSLLFVIFPFGLIAAVVRGDPPAWFYIFWLLGAAGTALFAFVLLPNYQDWFNGEDLKTGEDRE